MSDAPQVDKAAAAAAAAAEKAEKAAAKKKASQEANAALELNPRPEFIAERIALYDKRRKEFLDELAAKTPVAIQVTVLLNAGKQEVKEAQSWRSTPQSIAETMFKNTDHIIIAKVNGEVFDLDRVLEADCKLEFLTWEDDEAKAVFWHSSAHMLGESLELQYGGCLCYGPPIDEGFYYDMHLENRTVLPGEFGNINKLTERIAKEKQQFERLELSKADLLEMFKYNTFKQRIINERVTTDRTTVYRCGPLIDLCRGPHVRHTGKVKSFAVTKSSASYWEGKADAETLQRVYGVSFPDVKMMKDWEKFQLEAAKRDHRKLGTEQSLFFFHELSPGSCFFLPHGTRIYNTLMEFIRSEYWARGFTEVITPNMYNSKLWQQSGHWQHYAENMFSFDIEKEKFALKPMNCPGHCLMFDQAFRSHKELPIRFADFGVLHRNEASGALTGLTRVRRFQQDDAHIFCKPSDIANEIDNALAFLKAVYTVFGFTFQLKLSTRPEGFLGDIALWDKAEKQLEESLNKFGAPWKLNPGDGAFYGPKIDITIMDALRRSHQCATIQLDFQLPIRFGLKYQAPDGTEQTPVIIHRAILGSVERMIAILTENFAGKWPFWLSPRQALVIAVSKDCNDYAHEVQKQLHDAGFHVDYDLWPDETLNKKVRNAQLAQYNFILVVGARERESRSANVRTRDNKVHGERTIPQLIAEFTELAKSRALDSAADEATGSGEAPAAQ
ncbi:threonyl-tRNA synthetase [Capsaspora owczarzaki ATCC 30864]|uniref:threonine--tRNA ligase n=1 Tax=Capsaspora owczarzaki (strain ATCC 30864) TaxID=595528 RepID=A0A0D2X1Z8_CAPO3|nr:threonyl-tRNA synthetase [Capsaspora owczarzaki ATCC 30864]KJE91684.1 threonyl-tRNA synthetase [Capsaspora owczarzaki ATCC 30864]|eukprot:XP_004349538.1 threonyl-tRNA synthetase [Capsaspora owczarzaki ATCC 30864]